ncbi:MAG: hypothetical protein R3314_06545 [Longimicrobiales bacterium]|nr:hypothetical protein [Longimicrobiales bacterium]
MTSRVGGAVLLGVAVAGVTAVVAARAPAPEPPPERLVFTEVATPDAGAPSWRFPDRSRIVAVDPADPTAEPVVLSPGFAAARAPDVHFDGRRIVFAGRRQADGPWQIWETSLDGGRPTLLVEGCERCTDPVYRADDGVVFVAPAGDGSRMAVYTVAPGDEEPTRITHHPLSDASLGLVSDGRVLIATGPASGPTRYYAVRHDGTGAELMYAAPDGATLPGRPHETGRRLVFVERSAAGPDRVVAVSQAYPETSRQPLATLPDGDVHSAFPAPDGTVIVAARRAGESSYGLWRAGGAELTPLVRPAAGVHAVEPVLVRPRTRPLGFVSATDPSAGTGAIFGVDARLTGLGAVDDGAVALRVRSPARELGVVPLARDGSFHIELPADEPVRFETLDADGATVRGPSAWIWVRPGELRGCVGCHESRALAPTNRLPDAAARPPVSLAVDPEEDS